MAYQHDIFISYKRDYIGDRWLIEQFLPHFRKFVANDISAFCPDRAPLPIFFDQTNLPGSAHHMGLEGIEPGEEWKPRLSTALEHSRCLVALCTPLYFRSPWCAIEWETFAQRARSTDKTLIVPVSIHDGDSFPEHARRLQFVNLARYWIDRLDHDHNLYSPFQQEVRSLAERVARVVASAPQFAEWRAARSADVAGEPL